MNFGILCGFLAAFGNSIGYLFSTRFLHKYNSPFRLLISVQLLMGIACVLFFPFVVPFRQMENLWSFLGLGILWGMVFMLGQGFFFLAQRYFEASRLASLLGLKIVVLALIFLLIQHGTLNWQQGTAILLATFAGIMFHWSGAVKSSWRGWLCLSATLVCFSVADISETAMIVRVKECGFTDFQSSLITVVYVYVILGLLSVPGLIYLKRFEKQEIIMALPYAAMWLISQCFLFVCFVTVQPVFGNVILATRGVFSVILGIILPFIGFTGLDSGKIGWKKWIQRGIAACIMALAIGLYSYAK